MRDSEFVENVLDIKLTPWQTMLINGRFGKIEPEGPKVDRGSNWESLAKAMCGEKGLKVLGFEGGYIWVEDDSESIIPVSESLVAGWIGETQ